MRNKRTLLLIALPVIVWALFGLLGDLVSAKISTRFGAQILAKGDGKIADVQTFFNGRLKDAAVLVTAACLVVLAYRLVSYAVRGIQAPARWIVQGWTAFICLNVFAAIADHNVLFWCLLFTGKDHSHNYTQWRIKAGLMKEATAPGQAVLIGASQTRTQIDPKVLNARLKGRIWTTELHFPGSTPYDMTLTLKRLPNVRVDYIITYVSPGVLYSKSDNGRLMYFFGLRDLPGYLTLGPGKPVFDRFMVYGLLGDIFPIYRDWEPLCYRARGWQAETQAQERYDAALETNLASRAQSVANNMGFGPICGFYKSEFVVFANMCRERHCRLVICSGQLNPILERDLDPALHLDMTAFLRDVAAKEPNIVLLEPSQFPPQMESDYEDLTHVTQAVRARYSESIADVLDKLERAKTP
jgi:hypothetical protein